MGEIVTPVTLRPNVRPHILRADQRRIFCSWTHWRPSKEGVPDDGEDVQVSLNTTGREPQGVQARPPAPAPSPSPISLGGAPSITWDDGRLVQACLQGDERAWKALIAKYRNLVYSIPRKYGASPEDAADIFQSVCLELFNELPRLRNSQSVRSWLTTVAAHQSFHWKRRRAREAHVELDEDTAPTMASNIEGEVEREQAVREAMRRLPARCRELVSLLFFAQPPLPYNDVAARLGMATGSIGFLRARCLKRLQQSLEELGF